jgi:hypothetical protein
MSEEGSSGWKFLSIILIACLIGGCFVGLYVFSQPSLNVSAQPNFIEVSVEGPKKLSVNEGALAAGYGDGRLESGKVLVRNYLVGASVSLFGSVESAPVVEPTVDPDVLTGEDAVGVAVALFVVAIAVCVGLVFAFKQAE